MADTVSIESRGDFVEDLIGVAYEEIIKKHGDKKYHFIDHTRDAVGQFRILGGMALRAEYIDLRQFQNGLLAMAFHDIVYVQNATDNEENSAKVISDIMRQNRYGGESFTDSDFEDINAVIMGTAYRKTDTGLLVQAASESQILLERLGADADLSPFGRKFAIFSLWSYRWACESGSLKPRNEWPGDADDNRDIVDFRIVTHDYLQSQLDLTANYAPLTEFGRQIYTHAPDNHIQMQLVMQEAT